MASGTFYPAASGDDGTWIIGGASFNSTGALDIGDWADTEYSVFIRFASVNIPYGSTITSAFVRLTAYNNTSDVVCSVNLYFNNVDNATNPTDVASADGKAVTASINWDSISAFANLSTYDTPAIETILQTVINRAGWSSGNHVLFFLKGENESDTNAYRSSQPYDWSGGGYKAELHVEWTDPPSGEISEDVSVNSEFEDNFGELGENVSVLSEFDDSMGELNENASVNSEFVALGSDNVDEDISVNSELVSEHTAEISEDASVNADFISEHTGELSEDASVNSEFVCYQKPANLDAELPMITADILGGQGGFLDATLPLITADIKSGAILEASLPVITAELEGKVGAVGNVDAVLPSLIANIEGKVEILGEIDAILPVLRASIKGKTGDLAICAATLPMLLADIQGYHDLTGDIDATLPMIESYMVGTPERESCEVLRYSR